MIDCFNPLQNVDAGVLPVSTHESIVDTSLPATSMTGTNIPPPPPPK